MQAAKCLNGLWNRAGPSVSRPVYDVLEKQYGLQPRLAMMRGSFFLIYTRAHVTSMYFFTSAYQLSCMCIPCTGWSDWNTSGIPSGTVSDVSCTRPEQPAQRPFSSPLCLWLLLARCPDTAATRRAAAEFSPRRETCPFSKAIISLYTMTISINAPGVVVDASCVNYQIKSKYKLYLSEWL